MLSYILMQAISIYSYALIIYVIMSWFPGAYDNPIGKFLARICEPYLGLFRSIIPSFGGIDISPILAILVLRLAGTGLYEILNFIL